MFTQALFKDIDKDELQIARKVIQAMMSHINEMDNKIERVEKYE
jgi:MarR family transcriptional regulator, transcriptional regulator for hemolysin